MSYLDTLPPEVAALVAQIIGRRELEAAQREKEHAAKLKRKEAHIRKEAGKTVKLYKRLPPEKRPPVQKRVLGLQHHFNDVSAEIDESRARFADHKRILRETKKIRKESQS